MWSGFFANQKNVFTFAVPKNDGQYYNLKILRLIPGSLNKIGIKYKQTDS